MSKSHADYEAAARKLVDTFGRTNGHKLPVSNDPIDAACQRYAMMNMVKKYAEVEEKKARLEILGKVDTTKLGKVIVHDSTYALFSADVRRGATRLDQDALMNLLVKECKLSVEKVGELFERARVANAPSAVLNVVLKQ